MKTRLIEAFIAAFNSSQKGISTDEEYSRRKFIQTSAATISAGLLLPNLIGACQQNNENKNLQNKKIAIIGAGISGLTTAYFLQKNKIDFTVFEASSRIGGRMFSLRNWANSQVATDLGAEFVCDYHHDLIGLAKELGVAFYDLRKDPLYHQAPSFFIEGKQRSFDDFVLGLQPAVSAIKKDIQQINFDFTYKNVPAFVRQLDQQSISTYLSKFKLATWVQKLIEVTFEAEYGMNANEQSVLNLLSVLQVPEQNEFELLGKDYEVLKIKNGTQTLADSIYKHIKQNVVLNHALSEYNVNDRGQYELIFNQETNQNQHYTFDYVVLSLPFTLLRNIKTNVVYPAHKQKAIDYMGYGNNCKTIFAFKEPAWRKKNKSGALFTDLSAQCGWDSMQEQRTPQNETSSITFFYGGSKSEMLHSLSPQELLEQSATIINKNLGIKFHDYYTNQQTTMLWHTNRYAKCSYTSFKVGDWTAYTGVPEEPFENIYFVGEHCSTAFQGFMNGAIQSAKKVATQLTHILKS